MGTKQYDNATDLITLTRSSGGTALRKISYGSEFVTNGTFDSDTTGWLPNANALLSVDTQRLKVETGNSGNWNYAYQQVTVTLGQTYRFRASSTAGTATSHRINLGTHFANGNIFRSSGPVDITFTATTNFVYVSLQNTDGVLGSYTFFDDISVEEVIFDEPDGTLQLFNHGNDVPRIEYNADGTVKGLLIEEARTNLQVHSGDFSNWAWSKAAVTVDTSYVAPDGTSTASKLTSTSGASASGIYDAVNTAAGKSFTCFMKAGSSGVYGWIEGIVGGVSPYAVFDLESATVVHSRNCEASIEPVGNGWFRCVVANTTSSSSFFSIGASDNTYTNSNPWSSSTLTLGKFIYAWGAQLEAGSFPTSYIPTTGATATRARDLASIPVDNFGYNKDAGSLVIDVETPLTDQFMIVAYFNTTQHYNSRGFVKEDGSGSGSSGNMFTYGAYDGGLTTLQLPNVGVVSETTKLGLSYKDNEVVVRDGGTVVSGTGRSTSPTQLYLGGRAFGGGHQSQCWFKSVKYYPRKLTDAQLQELTT